MAKQYVVLALIFFAVVGMASASTPSTAAAEAPAAAGAGVAADNVIGSISQAAKDAAPVGGPVPAGVFKTLSPGPSPASGAAALEMTTFAGAVVSAGLVGSFFF